MVRTVMAHGNITILPVTVVITPVMTVAKDRIHTAITPRPQSTRSIVPPSICMAAIVQSAAAMSARPHMQVTAFLTVLGRIIAVTNTDDPFIVPVVDIAVTNTQVIRCPMVRGHQTVRLSISVPLVAPVDTVPPKQQTII